MKKAIITFLIILSSMICKSQTKLEPLKSFDARAILSKLNEFKTYALHTYYLRVYIFFNESGSAKEEGTDSASSSMLIVKNEYGEHEIPEFYMIKDLMKPKIIQIKENEISVSNINSKVVMKFVF